MTRDQKLAHIQAWHAAMVKAAQAKNGSTKD